MLSTWETVLYTTVAIIPGFLIDSIIRTKIPMQKRTASFSIFSFISLSALNYFLWAWKIPALLRETDRTSASFIYWCIGIVFISPLLLGFIINYLQDFEIIKRGLKRIRFKTTNLAPSAWDYKFYNLNQKGSRYIIVTLTDDTVIYGAYGLHSYSSNQSQDLYIEKIYKGNKWEQVERSDGILITNNQIKHIEFFV